MIIKIDEATEARLSEVQKVVAEHTGLVPQNTSLVAQVLLQWAMKRLKDSTLRALAPQMLSLSQQRKAVINEMLARQEQMDGKQIKNILKALQKTKRKSDVISASSPAKPT